jgi:hypothetical protein
MKQAYRWSKFRITGASVALLVILIYWRGSRNENSAADGSDVADATAFGSKSKSSRDAAEEWKIEKARLESKAWDSIRRQKERAEADGSNRPPDYQTFGDNGRVTTGALLAAKIDKEDWPLVESTLAASWRKAELAFASRITIDEARSDRARGVVRYAVRTDPAENEKLLSGTKAALDAFIGSDKREILLKGLDREDCFGLLGNYDIEFVVDSERNLVSYEYRDSETGRIAVTGAMSMEGFPKRFGDALDISGDGNE